MLSGLSAFGAAPPNTLPSAPPNIVLAVSDDIPRNAHGAYGAAHGLSPNIDSLARDGVTFTRAYTTTPLCTPARFSLLTGRFAANASSIVAHRPWNYVGFNTFLTRAEPTVAEVLAARRNYTCGFVGKYHLGFPLPQKRPGARAQFVGGARGLKYDQIVGYVRANGGFEWASAVWGSNRQTAREPHHPEWMTAEAVGFVRRAVGEQRRPFFLYFAGTVPHSPFTLPGSLLADVTLTPAGRVPRVAEWVAMRNETLTTLRAQGLALAPSEMQPCGPACEAARKAAGYREPVRLHGDPWMLQAWLGLKEPEKSPIKKQTQQQRALARTFTSGLHWFDRSVGTLLGALRELGVYDQTLVAYVADHGPSFLGKGAPYEAGVRVPLVVKPAAPPRAARKGRRRDPGGAKVDATAVLLDIFPTLLAAAGLGADEVAAAGGHGRSLLPLLAPGATATAGGAAEGAPVFFEVGYARGVLRHPWKLFVVHDTVDRCKPWGGGDAVCRNFHAEEIEVGECNFTASAPAANATVGIKERGHLRALGACNMTYDAVARHPRFCDRRQLYHVDDDPLEQRNVADAHPEVYDSLLALILAHVRSVEAASPVVKRTLAAQPDANHPCGRNRG